MKTMAPGPRLGHNTSYSVKLRDLADRLRPQVVGVDVQRALAVGGEVHRVPRPHREVVGAGVVGQALGAIGHEVVDPDVLRAAAAGALPGAELAVDGRVGDLPAVRGQRRAAALRQLQRRLQAARGIDHEVAPHAVAPGHAVHAHEDLAFRRPAHHPVVPAAARGHGADVVVEGELLRRPAPRGHHVHLARARVLRAEGDPAAVGRDLREQLEARVRGQPARGAARRRRLPDVAAVDEHHGVAVDVGEAEQAAIGRPGLGGTGGRSGEGDGGGEQDQAHDHSPEDSEG